MFWHRKKREEDLERELRSHLELETQEQQDRHASPEGARDAARRALGNTTLIREATREAWGLVWVDEFTQDLRYGCRALSHSRGFAAMVMLTAALGIGANTSIFSVVHAVLMHPLPYKDADRLVSPVKVGKDNFMGLGVADFQYAAWRDQAGVWDAIAAYAGRRFTITGNGEPEQLKGDVVTPGFLHMLGIAPVIGRDFSSGDAEKRGGHVTLISYRLWKRRFGGDPAILSRTMTLDGKPYTIAGVLPREFEFPASGEISVVVAMSEPGGPSPGGPIFFYSVIGRLKPNATSIRAQAALTLIDQRLEPSLPAFFRSSRRIAQTRVIGLHDRLVGDVRPALLVLSGAVALVLLIVCVNISNLLLARAIARQKEIAVRIALGAGRGRVVRQLLAEGLLLAASGGAAGLALAFGGVALLRAIAPEDVPHIANAGLSGAVLAFNLAIALLSGLLFGLAPLRGISGMDPEAALKQTPRSTTNSRKHRRLENLLIVSETAFALILLAGAGLLMRTFAGLTAISPGFQPDNVLTAHLSLPYWKYPTLERQRAFLDQIGEKLRTGPGVTAAGAAACLPFGGPMMMNALEIEGNPAPARDGSAEQVAMNFTSGDYFRVLKIPILEGRALDRGDTAGRPGVVVVNQLLARHFFPGVPAVGARIRPGESKDWLQIVGVIGDLKQGGLASEVRPEMFQSAAQSEEGGSAQTLTIRSAVDPKALLPWLRAQIAEADKDLPPPEIETMRTRMASLVATQLFVLRLLGLFAGIAITLAAMGIYSVLVYSVERRTHEIGIRLALGARRVQIMGLVMSRGLWLSIAGSVIGTAGGLMLTRYLKSLLYGVTPHDPLTLGAGCAIVIVVALVAAYFPARRAVQQDPITTLRAD
jgi:putative ABC transport system permease protein